MTTWQNDPKTTMTISWRTDIETEIGGIKKIANDVGLA